MEEKPLGSRGSKQMDRVDVKQMNNLVSLGHAE